MYSYNKEAQIISTIARILNIGLYGIKVRQCRLSKTSPGWMSDNKRKSVQAATIFRYYPEKYPRHVTGRHNIHMTHADMNLSDHKDLGNPLPTLMSVTHETFCAIFFSPLP